MASKRAKRRKEVRRCENHAPFGSQADAIGAMKSLSRRKGESGMSTWRCGTCGRWHFGHTPRHVKEQMEERYG